MSRQENCLLAEALKQFLRSSSKKLGKITITSVEQRGREMVVRVKGRRKPAVSDRTALLTLVGELWRGKYSPRRTKYLLADDELVEYVFQLSRINRREAQAVWLHIDGGIFRLPFPRSHRLGRLFSAQPFAHKHLNEAASAGAMIKRALPHARKGSLPDRVAAVEVIVTALGDAGVHRYADSIYAEVKALATQLLRLKNPLLKEAAWVLDTEHDLQLRHQLENWGGRE